MLPGQTASPGQAIPPGQIDAWIAIAPDGAVTLFTGKVELGTGVSTALAQIAAEELDVALSRMSVVQGDTARTPDQGGTVGSKTLQRGGAGHPAGGRRRAVHAAACSPRCACPPRSISW